MSGCSNVGAASAQPTHRFGQNNRAEFGSHMEENFASALKSAGVDASKSADVMNQIKQAVGATNGSPAAVRDAVQGVLKDNGVDVDKFESAMRAHRHHRHRDGGGAAPSAAPGSAEQDVSAQAVQSLTGVGGTVDKSA